MAEKCAHCGLAGYLQAGIRHYQCLACGKFTSIATKTETIPVTEKPPLFSNAGYPVEELSYTVTQPTVVPVAPPEETPVPIEGEANGPEQDQLESSAQG